MSDLHNAVGSYVTDALDASEREEFERHLAVCEGCRQEVLEFRETLAELTTLTAAAPPPAMRASVLAAIHEVRPLPPEVPEVSTLSVVSTREPEHADEVPLEPHPSEMPWVLSPRTANEAGVRGGNGGHDGTDELAARRRTRGLPRFVAVLTAAALVAALALGGWVYQLRQQQSEIAGQQAAQAAEARREADLLSAPDARVVTASVRGARVSYVVSKQRNEALFIGQGMAEPGSGRAYQLWTVQGEDPTPAGLINRGGNVRQWMTGDIADADVLAVTVEAAGGATTPTLPILGAGKLA